MKSKVLGILSLVGSMVGIGATVFNDWVQNKCVEKMVDEKIEQKMSTEKENQTEEA